MRQWLPDRFSAGQCSGIVFTNQRGQYFYQPDTNYFGDDSLTFALSDGMLNSEPATITFHVDPVNDGPIAFVAALRDGENLSAERLIHGARDLPRRLVQSPFEESDEE